MAQEKLWLRRSTFSALMMSLLASVLTFGRTEEKPIGFTLLFQSAGRPVVVQRFDPDGRRGPVPGAVGGMYPRGGAEMSFMPGDSEHGIPKFVEVAWVVPTDDFERWASQEDQQLKGMLTSNQLSTKQAEFRKRWAANPHYTRRVDLTHLVTPELVERVRVDRQNTQLKLIVTFNNSTVDIKAIPYKWR